MIEMSKASSLSASGMGAGLLTFAMSTLTPFCSIGVMTMKMISSTSITSTMGVTLMFEFTFEPSSRFASAMVQSPRSIGIRRDTAAPYSGYRRTAPRRFRK